MRLWDGVRIRARSAENVSETTLRAIKSEIRNDRKLFDKDKNAHSNVILKILDLPEVTLMGKYDYSDEIMIALAEAPNDFSDALYEKPVIQEIINQRWNLVK
jgi:hypothetical protein